MRRLILRMLSLGMYWLQDMHRKVKLLWEDAAWGHPSKCNNLHLHFESMCQDKCLRGNKSMMRCQDTSCYRMILCWAVLLWTCMPSVSLFQRHDKCLRVCLRGCPLKMLALGMHWLQGIHKASRSDVFTWIALIVGYALEGWGQNASRWSDVHVHLESTCHDWSFL